MSGCHGENLFISCARRKSSGNAFGREFDSRHLHQNKLPRDWINQSVEAAFSLGMPAIDETYWNQSGCSPNVNFEQRK